MHSPLLKDVPVGMGRYSYQTHASLVGMVYRSNFGRQMRGNKQYPFKGLTKYARVGRKAATEKARLGVLFVYALDKSNQPTTAIVTAFVYS